MLGTAESVFVPLVADLSHPACSPTDRKHALFIIDDFLEFCGLPEGVSPFYVEWVPHLLSCASPECEAGLRQAAVYGLGMAAEVGGAHFSQFAGSAVEALASVIAHHEAYAPGNEIATDNAIHAMGKIAAYQDGSHGVNASVLFPEWLKHRAFSISVALLLK